MTDAGKRLLDATRASLVLSPQQHEALVKNAIAAIEAEAGALQATLEAVVEAALDLPPSHPRWRYFSGGRVKLVGPWDIEHDGYRPTWQAIAEPYNATGVGLDCDIEGLGPTPLDALKDLLAKLQ